MEKKRKENSKNTHKELFTSSLCFNFFLHPNKMDSSTRLERIRNRTIFTWYADKAVSKPEQGNEKTNQIMLCRQLGSLPFFVNGKPEDLTIAPMNQTSSPYSLDKAVLLALQDLLVFEAEQNLGPTRCSRFNYLWFCSVAMAWNWISGGPISGTKDTWNWSIHHPLLSENDQLLWMNRFLVFCMPYFIPGYSGTTLLEKEREVISELNIPAEVSRIQTSAHWSDFQTAWLSWWTYRQSDGFLAAVIPPVAADLPNSTQSLQVTASTDNPNTFLYPEKWTPLKLPSGVIQKYLTYNWKDVLSSGLTTEDETVIEAAAMTAYPTNVERETEINEVVAITNTLTDTEKVTAEFWAGGPFTISPPGMCIWFWKEYMSTFRVAHTQGFKAFFYSGLDLAIHIFETGRLVWGLKKAQMQARPIQEIRRLYRGQPLTKYDGTPILGELWVPYQETNFVTPPFADFPSGHSAFSQSFALVMTDWFGSTIPTSAPSQKTDLSLLSPVFAQAQTGVYGSFVFPKYASLIQGGAVPSVPITLSWRSWQDMANSAGISRKYGGIHATSAHVGSQALAQELHTRLRSRWFAVS